MGTPVKQINNAVFNKINTGQGRKSAKNIVTNRYEDESSAGQTVIDLGYSVEVGVNDANFLLFIDGTKLSSDDFSFSNIITGRATQVTLNSPLVAGLSIDALQLNIAVSSLNALQLDALIRDKVDFDFTEGLSDFVVPNNYDSPNTEIERRASVKSGFEAGYGLVRRNYLSLDLVMDEFGPNGEPVYRASGINDESARFVGDWSVDDGSGGPTVSSDDAYFEVIFYGTGLNLLVENDGTARDFRASVDGGVEGANLAPVSTSSILNNRNYRMNCPIPVANGLSLDWHHIKIRRDSGIFTVFGVEVLNETDNVIAINSGKGVVKGRAQTLLSALTSSYNAGVVGTNGARVVKYLLDGLISQSVQEIGTAQYLTSSDLSNSELVIRQNWRDFGRGRSDDFSTQGGSGEDNAFVLDEGSTTLVSDNCNEDSSDNTYLNIGGGGFLEISFVGTGLSATVKATAATSIGVAVDVDGANVGDLPTTYNQLTGKLDICSDLPYGSHVVKFRRTGTNTFGFKDFMIYQPSKPAIPSNAFEVADYNILADLSVNNTAGLNNISQGVIRKFSSREFTYRATGFSAGLNTSNAIGGIEISSSANGNIIEYTFFGTGFELRGRSNVGQSSNILVELNGATLTTTNFPTISDVAYGGYSFNNTTGILANNGSNTNGSGLSISNLPLGLYTITTTNQTAASRQIEAIDIITPVHINNLSMSDYGVQTPRKFDAIPEKETSLDLGKAKALLEYDQINNEIRFSKNIAAVIDTSTGEGLIFFEKPFKNENYVAVGSVSDAGTRVFSLRGTKTRNFVDFRVTVSSSAASENRVFGVAFFGELQDEE